MNIDRSDCDGTRHGTADAYRHYGCRCPDATAANTRYGKMWRAGLIESTWVDNIGVTRRRQALAAIGYGLTDLAPYFGLNCRSIGGHTSQRKVHRDTFAQWCRVYDLLSMTPGPNQQARKLAQRQGWPPPLAWDDDTIDDPAAKPDLGDDSARSAAELAAEAQFLLGFGMSRPAVAKQLRISEAWLRQLLGGGKRAAA